MRLPGLIAATLMLFATPLFAQTNQDLEALTRAEQEARQRQADVQAQQAAVQAELSELKTALQETTQQTQAFERENIRLIEMIEQLDNRISGLSSQLNENREKTQELLAVLQRLELVPNQIIISNPDDAVKTAQAARMIETLSSELQMRAQTIARLSSDLAATQERTRLRRDELQANRRELDRRRSRTAALVDEKETLRAQLATDAAEAAQEVTRLASEAETLRELLQAVRDQVVDVQPRLKPTPPTGAPLDLPGNTRFAEAHGALIKPVAGSLLKPFGRGEQGETYLTFQEGQVIAPYAGRVEFAGAFKTYGRVVILNMDDGYFLLLTGLGRTFVEPNEMVKRGEPIGLMPSSPSRPFLYLELRQDGQTINPAPWFG